VLHHFKWAGADVFVTASALGNRRCVVVETNSCPSGQKSQPLVNDASEQARCGALHATEFGTCTGQRACKRAWKLVGSHAWCRAALHIARGFQD
jgi:hypothetical protein